MSVINHRNLNLGFRSPGTRIRSPFVGPETHSRDSRDLSHPTFSFGRKKVADWKYWWSLDSLLTIIHCVEYFISIFVCTFCLPRLFLYKRNFEPLALNHGSNESEMYPSKTHLKWNCIKRSTRLCENLGEFERVLVKSKSSWWNAKSLGEIGFYQDKN